MTKSDESTEERIRHAARRVFQRKGLAGARMQEIADDVGINKAMLHYYFESKEKLFEAVFEESATLLFSALERVVHADMPFRRKVELFVDGYVDVLLANPHIPAFVLGEVNRDPARMSRLITRFDPTPFADDVLAEIRAGRIRTVDPRVVLVDLLSLCAFPFAARPLMQGMLALDDDAFRAFALARKQHIPELLFASLAP